MIFMFSIKVHVNAYMKKLGDLIKDGNVSAKVKFKLMDVVEMRENDWVQAKRRVPQITTIDQVSLHLGWQAAMLYDTASL